MKNDVISTTLSVFSRTTRCSCGRGGDRVVGAATVSGKDRWCGLISVGVGLCEYGSWDMG